MRTRGPASGRGRESRPLVRGVVTRRMSASPQPEATTGDGAAIRAFAFVQSFDDFSPREVEGYNERRVRYASSGSLPRLISSDSQVERWI